MCGDPNAEQYQDSLVQDPRIAALIEELQDWPGPAISSHKSAKQHFHKLVFLAEIGVSMRTPGVVTVVDRILDSLDENFVPCIGMNIGRGYGGTGQPAPAWALCDAPNTLYALRMMGCEDQRVTQGIAYLASLVGVEGFGCQVSQALGAWRGPGKKSDPCPYATLIMLRLLIQEDPEKYRDKIENCAACLLGLWELSLTRHPYIFYMGNDFRRLKAPNVWYDILHVVEVLSRVPAVHGDARFQEMVDIIRGKATPEGFVPESVYVPWNEWDFGQKRLASPWITFCVERILRRIRG